MELTDLLSSEMESADLLDMKVLFLQEQYRRCIEACNDMVNENLQPLEQTFIKCYSAFAHDEIARAMHNFSHSKVLALSDAEQLYREALRSIPTAGLCISAAVVKESDFRTDSFIEQSKILRYPTSKTLEACDSAYASTPVQSPTASTQIRNDHLPDDSSLIESPGDSSSEFDDLESHESYDQIMTPSRVAPKLERDYSSMSLLQSQPQPQPQPQRGHTTAHGLMRPIRLGEPPSQYYIPPWISDSSDSSSKARLPRLQTNLRSASPVRKQLLTQSEQASPEESPIAVSPLGSENVASDASTISSLSPETPIASRPFDRFDLEFSKQRPLDQLEAHLEGMRVQLESHIRLLQEAKQQTIKIQSERAVARLAPSTNMADRRIQQSHSFWSFTPVDIKAVERQRRIEAGRKRGWMRVRFDPTRYRRLAERALAEL